jgi:hypothetical protein
MAGNGARTAFIGATVVAGEVPEFGLEDRDAAEQITVRVLLNHTNGMDADALGPTAVRRRDAAKS